MADNLTVAGIGVIATDDVSNIHHQRVKVQHGADGSATDVSTASPLPVGDAGGSLTVDGSVSITGAVTINSPAVTNAGTFVTQENGAALTALQLLDNVVAVEDAVAGSGFSGVPVLVVRQDIHSDLAADGDFIPLTTDADGGLRVSIVAGAGSGGTAMADDAAFTVAVTSVTPVAGIYRTSRDSVNDNDAGALAMTATRGLYTCLETPLGDSAMDDTTNAVKVHIVGDDVGSGVADEDGSVARGQTNVAMVITAQYEDDGSALVRVTGPHTVAHDAADAGNPAKLGAKATTSISALTPVTTGDRTNVFAGADGVVINRPHCNLEDIVTGNASNTDGASTQCIAAQAAGIKTYLTTIILTNTHASTDGYVEIKDGSTVKCTIPVPHASGAVINFSVPLGGTAATAWNFDPSAAITTVICSMVGFKSKL